MQNEETNKKSQIEKTIQKTLKKTHPNALQEYEITVKPLTTANVNAPNIQNLVQAVYYVYLQGGPEVCSNLYPIVKNFAKAFKEDQYLKEMEKLWTGKKNELLVPALEAKVIRAMNNPGEIRRYNYGGNKTYTLGDINIRLKHVKIKLFGIFQEIYLKNDVQETFQMPQLDTTGGMPEL